MPKPRPFSAWNRFELHRRKRAMTRTRYKDWIKKRYFYCPPIGADHRAKNFPNKKSLLKYLRRYHNTCIGGMVSLSINHPLYFVEEKGYIIREGLVLKQTGRLPFKYTASKEDKRFYGFKNKIEDLMYLIDREGITKSRARRLVDLFYKSGFNIDDLSEEEKQMALEYKGVPDYYEFIDVVSFVDMYIMKLYFEKEKLL